MVDKRPIDIKRDSAVTCTIESETDGTEIMDILELNGDLLFVTKKAVYEVKLADRIDPKRENPSIPQSVQRRILEVGTDSELWGRTLLTAKNLFRKEFLPSSIDLKQALVLSFEVITDMVAMQATATEYELVERKELQAAEKRRQTNKSFAIPCISDVKSRCKTFSQKADHVAQTTWDIVRLFYPAVGTKCKYESLHGLLRDQYGDDDGFTTFIEGAIPFLRTIRNTRDCLEHRNAKGVAVTDFVLRGNGMIDPPSIEIKFRGTNQPIVALSAYMPAVVASMLNVFESLITLLCSKQVQSFAGFPIQVAMIPENRRRNRYVRYGYCTSIGGKWAPVE